MLIRDGAGNAVKGARCSGLKSMSCVAYSLQLALVGALMRARKSPTPPAPRDKHTKKKATQSVPSISTSSGPPHVSPSKPSSQHQQTTPAGPSESHHPGPPRPSQSSRASMGEKENEENVEEDLEFIEESETDNDDEVADNSVDYQVIRKLRDATRRTIGKHKHTTDKASSTSK
jgi:hypothetical protein